MTQLVTFAFCEIHEELASIFTTAAKCVCFQNIATAYTAEWSQLGSSGIQEVSMRMLKDFDGKEKGSA